VKPVTPSYTTTEAINSAASTAPASGPAHSGRLHCALDRGDVPTLFGLPGGTGRLVYERAYLQSTSGDGSRIRRNAMRSQDRGQFVTGFLQGNRERRKIVGFQQRLGPDGHRTVTAVGSVSQNARLRIELRRDRESPLGLNRPLRSRPMRAVSPDRLDFVPAGIDVGVEA
jgi:hypothetical protein